jgi:hypothetical protein
MEDLAIYIMDWDEEGIAAMKEQFMGWGYPNIFSRCDRTKHETENMNLTHLAAAEAGFKYYHMANADVVYNHQETIPALYDYIKERPDVGAIHPWVQGEEPLPHAVPYDAYLQDATGITLRLNMNGWVPVYDEEYLGTGWSDLDLGEEILYRGFRILNDRRWPVRHNMGNTKRRDEKSFLKALERRSRLILSAKWWWVGRADWKGAEAYNATVPVEKQIPSMNLLMNYTDTELETFWRSIHPEHPQIRRQSNTIDHNDYWENPIIVGYSTRDKVEAGEMP